MPRGRRSIGTRKNDLDDEVRKNDEIRKPNRMRRDRSCNRYSDFELPISFGIRISGFGFSFVSSETNSLSDEDLARQSQTGSMSAFEELVYRYENRIYVANYCRNPADAREVTQDTF